MGVEFGAWFRTKKTDMRWLPKSPTDRTSRCDAVWSHVVPPGVPRLQVDSMGGPVRKRGKGKRHEYLCVQCAMERYGVKPPTPVYDNQGELF